MRPTSVLRTYAHWSCIALLVLATVGVTVWHVREPVLSTRDDGFYYYQIARNVARGAGSTFDGTNLTNGYQPLWLILLVPIFWIARSSVDALSMGIVLQGIALACTLIILFVTARLRYGVVASLLGALLWLVWMAQESFKGLEFSIHALGICVIGLVYLAWFANSLPSRHAPYLLLGLACSLAFLARIDTLLLAMILGIDLGVRGLRGKNLGWGHWLLFAVPVLITVSAYVLINQIFFGHVAPVSGVVKATWSQTLLLRDPLFQSYGWLGAKLENLSWSLQGLPRAFSVFVVIGTFGTSALWLARWLPRVPARWRDALTRVLGPLTPFVVYSVASYLLLGVILHGNLPMSPWYYVIQPWLTAMLVVALFDALRHCRSMKYPSVQRLVQFSSGGVLVLLVAILGFQLWSVDQFMARGMRYEPLNVGAEWARTHLAPNAVIGSWNAGAIGYLSERRTVNLDGLVNSFDYFEHTRFDLCSYWRAQGITHLVDVFERNYALAVIPTYGMYASCAASLRPVWSDTHRGVSWRLQVYELDLP